MAGETPEEVEVVDPVADAQADADFDAGFDAAPDLTTTPEVVSDAEPAPEPTPAPVVPEVKYVQVTEAQLNDLMGFKNDSTSKFDKAFGQLGGLKQALERIQKETPSGQAVEVSEEDFAEMSAEFPELAKLQIQGMNKALAKLRGGGGPAVDQTMIERIVQERYGSELADAREDALDGLHNIIPNWDAPANTAAMGEWLGKQSAEVQALSGSEKVRDAAKLLRLYRDRVPEKVTPPPVSTRQRQLEAAISPRSAKGAAPAPAEVDEFEAGFNSARN